MAKKNENSTKAEEMASAIAEDFQKVLAKHGLVNHKITKFSLAPTSSAATLIETVLNCPPGFHKQWICRTVNGVTTCGDVCVKDPQ
jgi:hypothetical protein